MMRVLNVISYSTLVLTFSIATALTYGFVYDYTHPPSVTKTVYSDKEVHVGGVLTVLNEISRLRNCRVISSREITNVNLNKVYELDPIDRDVEMNKDGRVVVREITIDIPKYLVAGDYTYQSVLNYYCTKMNYAFGPIVIRTPIVHFRVLD